jgi:Family of unknown function (DUF6448)
MRRLHHTRNFAAVFVALLFLSFCVPLSAWAHCDSLEGPVVKDARVALEKGDVTPVLKWVTKDHELEIRDVFRQTMAVRAKGEEAKALADMYFFETLVRIHRAGEGEAFTGLKPAGSVEPGIEAADEALRSGSAKELATHLSAEVADGIQRRFSLARERGAHAADSVDAGRQYVDAYVDYIHYVETVHRLVAQGVSHLHHEPTAEVR